MKQYLVCLYLIFILLIITLMCGCIFNNSKLPYEKGEIDVTFKEGTTVDDVYNLTIKHNCTVNKIFSTKVHYKNEWGTLAAIIGVPEGKEKEYVDIFSKEPIVLIARLNEIE